MPQIGAGYEKEEHSYFLKAPFRLSISSPHGVNFAIELHNSAYKSASPCKRGQ